MTLLSLGNNYKRLLSSAAAMLCCISPLFAQFTISGPTCAVAGTAYNYNIEGSWTHSTSMDWGQTTGTINGSISGTPLPEISVTFPSAGTYTVKVSTTTPSGSASLTVTVVSTLNGGTVENPSQSINYGAVPSGIDCPDAFGGSCSPSYTYQWQSSPNNVTYTNISGATSTSLSFSSGLTATTYYRRFVTETTTSNTAYSTVAQITVYPVLVPGSISPSSQLINYNTIPPTALTLSGVSGGTNSYTYVWESSTDGVNWSVAGTGFGTTYTPPALQQTTHFRVLVTSNNVLDSSSIATVTVNPEVLGGIISPAYASIASGTSPGELTTTAASGGGCSGSYSYQWQSSTDGIHFTNISGITTLNYTPGNPTAATWFRRQVTCSGDVEYSNSAQIVIGTTAPDMNFIVSRTLFKPGVTDTATAAALSSPTDVQQVTQFLDGLGRPVQTVAKQSTPLQKDLVSFNVYDSYGREIQKYLPYAATTSDGNFKVTAISDQYNFNNTQYPSEQYYYSETSLESSPLNRPLATYAPGMSWAGSARGVSSQYLLNQVSDSVRVWGIAYAVGSIPTTATTYAPGTLYKNVTTDEAGHQVITYTDFDKRVILKKVQQIASPGTAHVGWLCTYYIYDDLGMLRFVIQPQAVILINSSWSISSTIAGQLCFRYEYDQWGRMNIKKIPGAGEVHIVYDERDRLVMSQDSNMRAAKQWLVTCYDVQNRPDSTGLITDATNYNNLSFYTSAAMATTPYPNVAGFTYKPLTMTHYDDYAWVTALGNPSLTATMDSTWNTNSTYFITTYNTSPVYAVPLHPHMITRGMVTGTTQYVLNTNTPTWDVDFYDDRGRVIQLQSTNYTTGIDKDVNQYDFSGKLLRHLLVTHKNGNLPMGHMFCNEYTYDAAFRMTGIKDNIDGPVITVDTLEYDELGRSRAKYLGGGIDSLVYSYNVRGWLTGINKNYVAGTGNDYFGMELAYDQQTSVSTTTYAAAQFAGNITGLIWKSAGDGINRKYDFTYDNLNRLTGSSFLQNPTGSTWNTAAMDYSVSSLSYDGNGNILSMNQKGFKVGAPTGLIDQLSYSYQTTSNQLSQVTDAVNDTASTLGDFHYKTKGSFDYTYDGNGNIKTDANKGIDSIQYTYLNQPQYIHIKGKGTITYGYDATGLKEAKITVDSTQTPVKTTTMLYIKNYQYDNDSLDVANFEEGKARYQKKFLLNGDSIHNYYYDYFLKDHLGNTRVILTTQKDTAQYMATMEAAFRAKELALFYNIDSTSYPKSSVPGGYPTDNTTVPNDSVAMVEGNPGSHTQGPALLLKVMTGDSISIGVKSYYLSGGTAGSNTSSLNSVLNNLADGLVALGGGGGHGTIANLNNTSGSPVYGALNSFLPSYDTTPASKPKAYLNWMLLDNQFNYVSGNNQSGAIPIGSPNVLNTLATTIKLKHSGYLYIWVSNETQNWMVFFDNLSVEDFTGPMLEETHYYPFGLTMAGISDKALKTNYAENKYRYNKGSELQNKEFSDGSGLELYSTEFRSLDPQLGRWWQIDPKPNYAESPYAAMGNNPILHNDPLGDTLGITFRTGFLGLGKKQNVNYNNGTLTNSDGSAYGGKVKGFLKQAVNALNAGRNGSAEARSTIGELQSSKNTFTIQKGTENRFDYNPSQRVAAFANQVRTDPDLAPTLANTPAAALQGGAGGTITWNPSGASVFVVGGGQDNNPTTNLLHELSHGQDANNGLLDTREYLGLGRDEWQATYRENIIRQQLGAPIREYYRVQDDGGTRTPLPPRILDANNNPIYPAWLLGTGWQ